MPNLTFRIMSAGAAAFFGGLFIGWMVLGKPFAAPDKAVAASFRSEIPRPGRIATFDEPLADPGSRPALRDTAPDTRPPAARDESKPRAPETKIAEPKPEVAKPVQGKPLDAKPADARPADAKPQPGAEPEIFPTRRLKKLAERGRLQRLIGMLDDEDDD
jgi:hypothetical protein